MTQASGNLRVAILSTDVQSRNHYIAISIAKAFARHPTVAKAELVTYVDAVDTCRSRHVDLLVAVGGAGAIKGPLMRAVDNARKSVLWTTEDPYEFTANQDLARHFDYVFSNDAGVAPRYKSPSGAFLPLAASRDIHLRGTSGQAEKLYDVFFVGTAWPNRIALLNKMLAKFSPNLRVKFGLSGNSFLPNSSLASLDMVTDFRVAPQEFAALAARSRVALTLDRDFSASDSSPTTGSSPPPRIFEIGVSRTPQVYLTSGARLTDLYETGKEIVVATTIEQAVKAIEDLLADPAYAEQIGEAAYVKTMSRHLYDHRVATILASVYSSGGKSPRKKLVRQTNQRPRILSVSHNVAGVLPFGGVELYQEMVSKSLLGKYDFFELYPARDKSALVLKHHTGLTEYETQDINPNLLFDHRREQIFQDILLEKKIDLVHFHHFLGGHSFGYPMIARAMGVPAVTTAHDYFMVCSQFTLTNQVGRYCHVSDPGTKACDICLSVRGLAPPGAQTRRREVMRSVLENVDRVMHSTQYTLRKFEEIYPLLAKSKHFIVGMASSTEAILFLESDRKKAEEEAKLNAQKRRVRRLQVSILGNFTRHKGGQILLEMFFQMSDLSVDFYIDGFVEHEFRQVLAAQLFRNVTVRGQYTQHQLGQRLHGFDLSIHFSTWPETYCIAIDEARAAGLVPIVLGFGALAERVHDGVDGFCLSPDHPYDLITLIARLAEDPGALGGMKAQHGALSAAVHQHLSALQNVYDDCLRQKPITHENAPTPSHRRLYFSDLGRRVNHPRWDILDVLYDTNATFQLGEVVAEEQRFNALLPNQVTLNAASAEDADLDSCPGALIGLDEIVTSVTEFANIHVYEGCRSLLLRAWLPGDSESVENALLLGRGQVYSIAIQERRSACLQDAPMQLVVGRFDPSELPEGIYRIGLAISRNGKMAVFKSDIFLNVGESQDEPTPSGRRPEIPGTPSVRHEKRPVGAWLGRIAARGSGGICSIDAFGKFFSATGENVLFRNQYQTVDVRGWILPKDKKYTLQEIRIELASSDWTAEFDAELSSRPDVACHFNDSDLEMCGFTLRIPVNSLPAGTFRVSVNGKSPKGGTITARSGTLTIV